MAHFLRSGFAAAVLALVAAGPVAAQLQRNFPQNALRGSLLITEPPEVVLNGRPVRLAPGARIRGKTNMIELTGGLVGARMLVHYTLDTNGQVRDVWILQPEEAAVRPWPTTPEEAERWTFDAGSQTWSKP